MPKIERSITVNAPVDKVFAYLGDARNQLEWVPGMTEVTDVVRTEQAVGSHYQWKYKMMGIPFQGESTTVEYVPNKRMVAKNTGIPSTWAWSFEPQGGGTKVSLVIDYTVPIPVLGKVAERLVLRQNEREADLGLANIKERVES